MCVCVCVCVCVCKKLTSVQCSSLRDLVSPPESLKETSCILKFACFADKWSETESLCQTDKGVSSIPMSA